jgi:hypothetical protein
VLPALTQSSGVSAQIGSKVYRLDWVSLLPAPTQLPPNVTFEPRWAAGDYQRVPELAAELERSGVDVILALGSRMARISQNVVKRARSSCTHAMPSTTLRDWRGKTAT